MHSQVVCQRVLTRAGTKVENRLFATLDSKLRRGAIGHDQVVVFADTVGFIRKLPHHLVASFKSTLEELTRADLVLHVIDRSHPGWQEQIQVAEEVMQELGVESRRILRVFNKSDLVGDTVHRSGDKPNRAEPRDALWASALTGNGLENLKAETLYRLEKFEAPTARVDTESDRLALP